MDSIPNDMPRERVRKSIEPSKPSREESQSMQETLDEEIFDAVMECRNA
jgi:hypothetical protein